MVPELGIEPTRCYQRQILSLVRLPFRHSGMERCDSIKITRFFEKSSEILKKSYFSVKFSGRKTENDVPRPISLITETVPL